MLTKKLKGDKTRKASSNKWLTRHINDPYVSQAKHMGYRSRAAFKLLQMDEKYHFIRKCKNSVIDLGSAPGSWLQVLENTTKDNIKIIGVDLHQVQPLIRSQIIVDDFTEERTIEQINLKLEGREIELILSDMAPFTCGDRQTDHLRIVNLVESALVFTENHLQKNGNFIAKIWHGSDEQNLRKRMKNIFHKVELFKPKSSYSDSSEIYLIGIQRK